MGFLFSCTTDPRAKLSDCINVDALNEEHLGRGNSKSKAKLALAAIVSQSGDTGWTRSKQEQL